MNRIYALAIGLLFTASVCAGADLETALTLHGQKDYVAAFKMFRELAEQGDPAAQSNVGYYYDKGLAVTRDPEEAVRWYRLAAQNGDLYAQYNLGVMYETGTGVPQDYAESFKWFMRSAEQGDREAAVYIGLFYEEGLGRAVDMLQAYAWFHLAAVRHDLYGARKRDEIAKRLDAARLEQAKAQARELLRRLGDETGSAADI